MRRNSGRGAKTSFKARIGAGICCIWSLSLSGAAFANAAADCHVGSYRLTSGVTVDIAPSDERTLRWRLFTGETGQLHRQKDGTWTSTLGWTDRPDGKTVSFSSCEAGDIVFAKDEGHRIPFDVTETTFISGGVKLTGRLVMPKGRGKVPGVVLVHGSEHDSAGDGNWLQRMFPTQSIGAFVYDKRGIGASGSV